MFTRTRFPSGGGSCKSLLLTYLKDLIDSLLTGYKKPEDLIGEHSLLKQLTKALVERALEAEMEAYLGHAKVEANRRAAPWQAPDWG